MRELLIFGANSPLGQACAEASKSLGVAYHLFSHTPNPGRTQYDFISDSPEKIKIDSSRQYAAILCSGYTNPDLCRENPLYSTRVNVDGMIRLLESFRKNDVIPVYISSDAIFDGKTGKYSENDSATPINFYGLQKKIVEDVVQARFENYLILRMSKLLSFSAANLFVKEALALRALQPVTCFNDLEYAPVFIEDISKFIHAALTRELYGVFHLAQDESMTRYEQGCRTARAFGVSTDLVRGKSMNEVQMLERRPKNTYLLNKKAKNAFGFQFTTYDKYLELLKTRLAGN